MNAWDQTFMGVAVAMAEHSTCARLRVGAVITLDKRIISTGCNGSPKGHIHCNEFFANHTLKPDDFHRVHGEWSKVNENHAESNAILFAAKNGISVNNCKMYTTLSCCIDCAKQILMSGINEVVYLEKYDRDIDGIDYLLRNGIICRQL